MAKRNKSWIQKQRKDHYVRQARASNYRSRAVYKLAQMDERDQLFRNVLTVMDIGSSPGSWSQYAREKIPAQGRVVAVDLLAMEEIGGVDFIQGDFTVESTQNRCLEALQGSQVDLVMSDMAPNLSGMRVAGSGRELGPR